MRELPPLLPLYIPPNCDQPPYRGAGQVDTRSQSEPASEQRGRVERHVFDSMLQEALPGNIELLVRLLRHCYVQGSVQTNRERLPVIRRPCQPFVNPVLDK